MVTVAVVGSIWKPGRRESDVEEFLRGGLRWLEAEPATTAWFGIRSVRRASVSSTRFRRSRQERASDRTRRAALGEKASELFAKAATIERVDVLAAKLSR